MLRDGSGKWAEGPIRAPELPQPWRPQAPLSQNPPLIVAEFPPIESMPFAQKLAETIPTDRPHLTANREYYLARAKECRERANLAASPSIELIHLDLATRYEVLARATE